MGPPASGLNPSEIYEDGAARAPAGTGRFAYRTGAHPTYFRSRGGGGRRPTILIRRHSGVWSNRLPPALTLP